MDFKKCPTPWKLLLEEVKEEIHSFPRKKISFHSGFKLCPLQNTLRAVFKCKKGLMTEPSPNGLVFEVLEGSSLVLPLQS